MCVEDAPVDARKRHAIGGALVVARTWDRSRRIGF
jgi:hypothetical protein